MKNRILLLSCITTLFLSCKSTNNLSHEHTSNNSYSNLLTDELVFILTYGKSKDEDLKVGVKNANNKILIEDKFENISKFYGNYANVVSNSNFGYINSNGRVKEFPEYDKVYWYTSNTGIVIKDCKYGLINRKGKLIQPLIYDNIHLPNQGFFIARKEKESILIKENGKVIHFDKLKLEGEYVLGSLVIYSDSVKVDGTFKLKKGLANLEQEIIIKAQFDEILNYKNNKGLFEVENNNKYGLVNLDGEVIIPIEYDAIDIDFNNDIISAQKNRKWGFIDVKIIL
ncbi:hypothetical protein DI383_03605 [Flavobacteriaceae bacterium LYZ1037]|nr:hypothetical protein DI383_03605 [Flavobacteriaceae bacterium LYZ1037]